MDIVELIDGLLLNLKKYIRKFTKIDGIDDLGDSNI